MCLLGLGICMETQKDNKHLHRFTEILHQKKIEKDKQVGRLVVESFLVGCWFIV